MSDEVLVWLSVWSEVKVFCHQSAAYQQSCPADATAILKPHHLLPHLNSDCFYLSGTGLPKLSWKRGH